MTTKSFNLICTNYTRCPDPLTTTEKQVNKTKEVLENDRDFLFKNIFQYKNNMLKVYNNYVYAISREIDFLIF